MSFSLTSWAYTSVAIRANEERHGYWLIGEPNHILICYCHTLWGARRKARRIMRTMRKINTTNLHSEIIK